jgi:DNA repair exonuclease SbcCD ATPase subunit
MEEETGLQCLNQIDDKEIRPDFVDQLKRLRTKVFKKIKPKSLNGQLLNGPMVIELAMAYVDALNTGKIPTIESAWDYMCSEENQKALKSAIEHIKEETGRLSKILPINSSDLSKHKEEVHFKSQEIFTQNILSGMEKEVEKEFLLKLSKFIEETYKNLERQNDSASSEVVRKYFEGNFRDLVRQNLRNDKYENYEDYEKDLELFKEEFNEKIKGEHFEKYLDTILIKFNERVFKDISLVKTRRLERELITYKERIKRAEEELKDNKSELHRDKERLNNKIEELESERIQNLSRAEILNEKLKFSEKDKDQKVAVWQEKCEKLEQQLEEKEKEVKKLHEKLEK